MKRQLWVSLIEKTCQIWELPLHSHLCVQLKVVGSHHQDLVFPEGMWSWKKKFPSSLIWLSKSPIFRVSSFLLAPVAWRKIWNFTFHLCYAALGFPAPTVSASSGLMFSAIVVELLPLLTPCTGVRLNAPQTLSFILVSLWVWLYCQWHDIGIVLRSMYIIRWHV